MHTLDLTHSSPTKLQSSSNYKQKLTDNSVQNNQTGILCVKYTQNYSLHHPSSLL